MGARHDQNQFRAYAKVICSGTSPHLHRAKTRQLKSWEYLSIFLRGGYFNTSSRRASPGACEFLSRTVLFPSPPATSGLTSKYLILAAPPRGIIRETLQHPHARCRTASAVPELSLTRSKRGRLKCQIIRASLSDWPQPAKWRKLPPWVQFPEQRGGRCFSVINPHACEPSLLDRLPQFAGDERRANGHSWSCLDRSPCEARLRIRGEILSGWPPYARKLALLFEGGARAPHARDRSASAEPLASGGACPTVALTMPRSPEPLHARARSGEGDPVPSPTRSE